MPIIKLEYTKTMIQAINNSKPNNTTITEFIKQLVYKEVSLKYNKLLDKKLIKF